MKKLLVINVVGLTPELLKHAPNLSQLAKQGSSHPLETLLPAVTTTVQASMLTGTMPSEHGIVANGWYFRDMAEVGFWKQSNHLVHGEMIWDTAKKINPKFTVAKLFWWYNMYSSADWSMTPRPIYRANGLKFPELYSYPNQLQAEQQKVLGDFPFFQFWGPASGIQSSDWIAKSAIKTMQDLDPTLTLAYLPHLDYPLQKVGPNHTSIPKEVKDIDNICGELIETAKKLGREITIVSEYGIHAVNGAVHINRILRKAGYLRVREEMGIEQLDAGASDAFAVADHQIAHIYVKNPANIEYVKALLEKQAGIDQVLNQHDMSNAGLAHNRSGELLAISDPDKWFTYYHFLNEQSAPDYARTVDIHRKPGYDPCELFIDPNIRFSKLHILRRVLQKKLGFRMLMDVVPLDANLVRGSHGRPSNNTEQGPLIITSTPNIIQQAKPHVKDVKNILLRQMELTASSQSAPEKKSA